MEINTVSPRDFQVIQGYDAGGFRISGRRHEGAVLVFPRRTLAWPVDNPDVVTVDSLQALVGEEPRVEILLLGTGRRMFGVAHGLHRALRGAYGVVLDVMDTGAACRTFNVLVAEGRPVVAALLVGG
ncbi:MAG TPA: Mth938-like domain-containing protein [Telmatospirillum sp.]|nr:Mth938-like domain-containing protein [Telmatospirillum sp.]